MQFATRSLMSMRFVALLMVLHCAMHQCPLLCAQGTSDRKANSLETPAAFPRFPAVEPANAEQTFVVQDGFQMQLIAAEPLVTDPVAMAIDEDGRAFVAEMNDYPYTNAKTHVAWQENKTDEPIGRIRLLEDNDGDGDFDRSTIFAEGLSWPSGVLCYRGGIFVTATPDIWYLKDTDGDRKADVRENVFTGFRKYNVQAVMNNPIWGLDNCIYVAGSSNGGSVLAPGQVQTKPIIARGDFRINPRTHSFELQAGGARFGNTFDDWGNRFLCNIRNPAIQVVLDNRYLARNPFYAAPTAAVNIAEAGDQMPVYRLSPVEPWRELRGRQWSADPTKKVPRSELTGGGVFTSTSGITVYRGHAYPAPYAGQMFEGEVANNTIYRQKVEVAGNTFRATRADQNVEFVASTDTWFRPVNLVNAPDGTLFVLDMYREFIEHPWSIPDDIHARLDLTSGRDRGRIYRLAPPNFTPVKPPALSKATNAELVVNLSHRDSWWRETAQRLLVERGDKSAAPDLRKLLSSEQPLAAVHALWTLVGLEALVDQDVFKGLEHPSPRVREHAVRVAEGLLTHNPQLVQRVMQLAEDSDSRVRLQVALSLGGLNEPDVVPVLASITVLDCTDAWIRTAMCSALPEHTAPLTLALLGNRQFVKQPSAASFLEQLASVVGAQGDSRRVAEIEEACHDLEEVHGSVLQGLGTSAKRRGRTLIDLFGADSDSSQRAQQFLQSARRVAFDSTSSDAVRIAAIARLTFGEFPQDLAELLEPLQSQAVQIAAVRAIASYRDDRVPQLLISRLRSLTPAVREETLSALLARPERTLALLQAVERQVLPASQLGLARKAQLLASPNTDIKAAALRVLGAMEDSRAAVVERYKSALEAQGDPERGRQVFTQQCAACHRAEGIGVEIGPHMETVRSWDRAKLLLNVLDPSREVAPQSMSYSLALVDGNVISGLIADETATSLTIKRPGMPPVTVLRQDIEQMSNSGLSLMPVGLEENISPAAMADLLTFLQTGPTQK